ncbi:MAG: AAA family ATPase [Actinobacteria bacterium]|nr:AAA family ATPase [Actinomycetota bacterium]
MPQQDERKPRFPFDLGGGGGQPGSGPGKGRWRFSLGYVLVALIVLTLLLNPLGTTSNQVPFSRLLQLAEDGNVTEVTIGASTIEAHVSENGEERTVVADLPPNYDPTKLAGDLSAEGVKVEGEQPSTWFGILSYLGPIILILAFYMFFFRRMAGGGAAGALNLGRNKVKIYDRKDLKTTFADVAGIDEAVQELHEIVDFLSNPKKYQRLGGRIPKGVLLLGPPGCGKTLLARAVAGEAKVPFFYMSGSEFVEMFVGLGAARVRELFQQAKEKAPCLVFLDELDTIGKSRSGALGGSMGGHDEREQTLNQLLVEMDGFDTSKGVIIMAATNRSDVLDPALLRPGRFDRQVVVDRPDKRGREAILKVHARGVALDPNVDLSIIAARTPGFTGADLANVVNEAALLAARREKNSVTISELEEAIDRVVAGLERKSRVLSDKEDRYLLTEPELNDRLTILLGGRTAEEISFKQISTGAQNDLQRATEIARAMVTEYGMSTVIGPISFGQDGLRADGRALFPFERPEMSEEMQKKVDAEVARLVEDAHERARVILDAKGDLLPGLSKLLMAVEVMEGKELMAYVEGEKAIPPDEELAQIVAERAPALEVPRETPLPPPPGPVEVEEGAARYAPESSED